MEIKVPGKTERYYVDERVGCIAIMDRNKVDPDYNGLDEFTSGVVEFWLGEPAIKTCPTCGHETKNGREVTDEQREKALKICEDTNAYVKRSCPNERPTVRFSLDPESGFVKDHLTNEWLTTAEQVFDAIYPYVIYPYTIGV